MNAVMPFSEELSGDEWQAIWRKQIESFDANTLDRVVFALIGDGFGFTEEAVIQFCKECKPVGQGFGPIGDELGLRTSGVNRYVSNLPGFWMEIGRLTSVQEDGWYTQKVVDFLVNHGRDALISFATTLCLNCQIVTVPYSRFRDIYLAHK